MKKHIIRTIIIVCALFTAGPVVDGFFEADIIVKDAEAIVGRPATPVSVAGVARRTTRRVVRRTAVYVSVLPAGCSACVVNGINLYQCGATYYQPQGTQYVVVVID
jgi:hypothetical protein